MGWCQQRLPGYSCAQARGKSGIVADNDNQAQGERADAQPVIVTIGASAGGVHALQSFFAALPEHPGAAFVVIVHLDPAHRSEMASIIAARTKMPVEIGRAHV